jgi:hypothetical protein
VPLASPSRLSGRRAQPGTPDRPVGPAASASDPATPKREFRRPSAQRRLERHRDRACANRIGSC